MNFNEVIVGMLNIDEFCGQKFGENNQLEALGWSERSYSNKIYILKCNVCSQDIELFGEGYFKSTKNHLVKGSLPCGCASNHGWSEDQYKVLCRRNAAELGYVFVNFSSTWDAQRTKIKMLCSKHGEWDSGNIHNLLSGGRGCPTCKSDEFGQRSMKSDSHIIQTFLNSGGFHPETKFWISNRTNNRGNKSYWYMLCPECGEEGV